MEVEASFTCVHCFQDNEIIVDGTGGLHQEYIEDCQICCVPNFLVITLDEGLRTAVVEALPA